MTYASEVAADAPYLWAKLNNAVTVLSGSDTGFSAASNNVTFTNGVDDPASGTSAGSFSGTSSYINWTTASSHSMFNTGTWSVEAWFKRSSATGNAFREIFNTYDATPNNAVTIYGDDSTGKVALYYKFAGQANTILTGPTISDTGWHHVVATRDGTTVRLYVDGALAASSTNGTTGTFPTSTNIWVGAYGTGASNENWNGRIDEIAVYKGTALSLARIKAHYIAGQVYGDQVLGLSPTLYLKLDEASGTVVDSSSSPRTVTLSGATQNATGILGIVGGKSVSFDGVDDYLSVASLADFANQTNWSMEVWFKSSQTTGTPTFIRRDGSGRAYLLRLNAGQVEFYGNVGGGSATSPTSYADGKWHHAVGVKTGTTTTLYVDGVSVATGTANTGTQSTTPATFIGTGAASSDPFAGNLDEVAIYHSALTASQVSSHYIAGAGMNVTVSVPAASLTLSMPSPATRVHAPAASLTLSTATPSVVIYDYLEVATKNAIRGDSSALDGTLTFDGTDIMFIKFPDVTFPSGKDVDSAIARVYVGVRTTGTGNATAGQTIDYVLRNVEGSFTEGFVNTSVPSSSTTYGSGTLVVGQFNNIDVSQIVALWKAGTTNHGILIDGETTRGNTDFADRTNTDVEKRPAQLILFGAQVTLVQPSAMTLSMTAPAPVIRIHKTVQPPVISADLTMVNPQAVRTSVPPMTGTLTFVGGQDANPDTVAVATFMESWLTTPNPAVAIRYPSVANPPAMELTLSAVAPTLNLTTGKLLKVNNAMSLTVRMVGIYVPEADRYHQYLPETLTIDDVWYKTEEADGATRAVDSLAGFGDNPNWYKQNGYYFGAPDFGVDGPELRKAVRFDGVDDYMIVGPYEPLNEYNSGNADVSTNMALTVEFSFKTTQSNGVIFAGTGASNGVTDYPVLTGNELRVENGYLIIDNHDSPNIRVRDKRVDDGQWHHIIMSFPSLEDGATGGTGGITSTGRPAFLMLDGQPSVVRYSFFGFDSGSGAGSWIPFSFMARAVPKFGAGSVSSTTSKPVASDTVTGFMGGDIRDIVVRLNGWVSINTAQKLYYEWSNSNVVIPPAMELSLSMVDPNKARGNSKRMLALYGLPWEVSNFGTDPQSNYFSNLSGMIIGSMSSDGFQVSPNNSGQGTLYWKPVTYTLNGYQVYPVSVVGVDHPAAPKPYSADGIISADAVTDFVGYFVDDHTGLRRFINLQEDLAESVEDFDCITMVNYPWEEPNHVVNRSSNVVGNEPENIEFHGAAPIQPNMGLTNIEWAIARDRLRDSILEAAYDGVDLWIGEYHMAQHLGFIQGWDIHKPGYWLGSSEAADGRNYNIAAEEIDRDHLPLMGDEYEWCGIFGDYYSNAQTNFYRRVVALEPGLTDLATNEYGDYVEGYAYDAWRPNGDFLAYDIVRRPLGLEIGDRVLMSMYFWKPGDPQGAGEQSLRFSVISAKPEGIVGKVITREMNEYYLPFGQVYDNPYKNNAITIAAERGTILRGRALGGRAFIELMDTNVLGEYIPEDANKFIDGGNPSEEQSSLWDFDTRRYREIKVTLVSNRITFDPNSGQFENVRRESNYFNYQDGDMIQNIRRSMHERGLNWLSVGAEDLPAGAVKAVVPAMELTLRTPAVGFSRTRNLNLPVIGAMRLDVQIRQPANYRDGTVSEHAFPMVLNLETRGVGKRVGVPPFVLSLTMPNASSVTSGERITVFLDGDRNITLFMKEDN